MKITKIGLSAAMLKAIAMFAMFVNHFFCGYLKNTNLSLGASFDIQFCLTRIAFCIFAFFIAEGMYKTKNTKKYLLRLLLIGIISQPIYAYTLEGGNMIYLNVMFDLLAGAIGILIYKRFFQSNKIIYLILMLCLSAISILFHFSFDVRAIFMISAFYIFRNDKKKMMMVLPIVIIITTFISYLNIFSWDINALVARPHYMFVEMHTIIGLPLIYLYNGQKGKQLSKWFYYFFYPVHLLIIYLLNFTI